MFLFSKYRMSSVLFAQLTAYFLLSASPVELVEVIEGTSDRAQLTATENTPTPIDKDRARFDKNLEAEKKSQYSFIQRVLANFLQPKPIVDSIREEDKYGNDGESFSKIGRGVVGGVTTLTNLLSAAVDIPFEALKNVTRKATATLNSLGTKLIGL